MENTNSDNNNIEISMKGAVATLTLSRPKKGNSLSPEMVLSLIENVQKLENNPEVRVIILTGNGENFCTGMDLSLDTKTSTKDLMTERAAKGIEMFEKLYHCRKPIISRINGPALGGGWGIVFTSDIRIALRRAFFWFPDVKRGIVPAIISCYIVKEIGSFRSRDLMLTGRKINADEALRMGMLTAVVDSVEELDKLVEKYAVYLINSASEAMAQTKGLINYIVEPHSHKENLQKAVQTFAITVSGKEAKHGIECFKKKVAPDWTAFAKL